MTFSIIQKSQLEGANRLDAEYYQPEYFIDFSKGNWKPIGKFLSVCQYGLSKAMNDEKIGYPMLKMDDIKDAFLFVDDVRYADITNNELNEYKLVKNDVLFNRVNSEEFVGRTGIFKSNIEAVPASYLIRLRTENDFVVLPDYLNVFLNSKFGIKQIRKFSRRAVNQANVNAEELKQIKIALLPLSAQKEIEKLSNRSWEQFELSKYLYSQAENLLLEELGLSSFVKAVGDEEKFCVVNLSDVKQANRIDAEYFQPKYEKLISKLSKVEKLSNLAKRKNGAFKLTKDKKYQYTEISDVNVSNGEVLSNELMGLDLPANAKIQVKGGELVVSKVRPTRGAIGIIPKNWKENHVVSGAFSVFDIKSPMREYLQVVLRSMIGKLQMERPTTGTSYPTITDQDVEDLSIPILPKTKQQKIADLVRKSHESRKKAKDLLEQAKQKVEELIKKE